MSLPSSLLRLRVIERLFAFIRAKARPTGTSLLRAKGRAESVAPLGGFDFGDFGAHVAEQKRGVRAVDEMGKIEDADIVEGLDGRIHLTSPGWLGGRRRRTGGVRS